MFVSQRIKRRAFAPIHMISITKIFRFETAHAIDGYPGDCQHIHGHSYHLHVTVVAATQYPGYLPGTGIAVDFKDLKRIVKASIVDHFDHYLILSKQYVAKNPQWQDHPHLFVMEVEPTAENLLIFISETLQRELPVAIQLKKLKLYETPDSFACWEPE